MIVLDYTGITAADTISSGASLGEVEFGLTTGATIADQSFLEPATPALVTAIVESPEAVESGGVFVTTIDISAESLVDVTSVVVDGDVFPAGAPGEPDTFSFNPLTNTLTITSSIAIATGDSIVLTGSVTNTSLVGSTLTTTTVETPEAVSGDGVFTTPVDISAESLTDVTSVVVNGTIFPIGFPGTPGTFSFNPSTNVLALTTATPIPTGATVVVTGFSPPASPSPSATQFATQYPTNWLCEANPQFLSTWNIAGTLQIDRTLKGWPSATFVMLVHKGEKDAVMAYFKPRQKLSLYGAYFECLTPTLVERPRDDFVEISVQMRGGWEREATDPVRLITSTAQNLTFTTLGDLCRRAGLGYSGPRVTVVIPRGTTRSASTTVMGEANNRAIRLNLFPFLSSRGGLVMRNYGSTPLHVLDPGDIMSAITHSKPGTGGRWNGIPLLAEYKNVEVQLSEEIEVARNVTESLESGHTRPTLAYRKLAVSRGEAVETGQPMEARDSNVWWPSGPSKNWRETIFLNNSPMEEEERVYALLGSPLSAYDVRLEDDIWEDRYRRSFNAQSHWRLVKQVRTRYEYGRPFFKEAGYLVKVVTRGWQYMNFTASGDLLSLRKQYYDEEGGDGALLRSLYNQMMLAQFVRPSALFNSAYDPSSNAPSYTSLDRPVSAMTHKVPINETTTYTLVKMRDYYPDMLCRSDDPDFVEPLFCIEEERISEDMAFAPDPRNIADSEYKRSPKITGQKRIERKTIEIIYPRKGTHPQRYDKRRDKFNTITYSSNYVGGDLAQSSVDEVFTESLGRPGQHTRLIKYPISFVIPLAVPETNRRIIVNTPNSGKSAGDLEEGSVSFPDTFTVNAAIAAAKNQINEQNLNAYTLSFDVRPCVAIDWQEGDRVQLFGRIWTILSISQIRNIEGLGRVTADGWPITLGLRMNIPVTSRLAECVA